MTGMPSADRRRGDASLAHCTALLALAAAAVPALPAHGRAAAGATTILVVGDSLSAEYGLQRGSGWVALLRTADRRAKVPRRASSTPASAATRPSGGRVRLPALLRQHQPDLVIIELGGNDALRGLPLDETRGNLAAMAQAAQGGRRAGADRRHADAAELRPQLQRAIRGAVRRRRAQPRAPRWCRSC